jgi:hypothetical protein
MDDFDDLRPRMSAPGASEGDREKRGAERPAARSATPDVYEAVQAARAGTERGSGANARRRTARPRAKKIPPRSATEKTAEDVLKDLDLPATISALAIGAVLGFVLGFFSGRERS